MPNLFYPKVVVSCFDDEVDKQLISSIRQYYSNSIISDFADFYSSNMIKDLSDHTISDIIREKTGNEIVTIPGDSEEYDVDYIVIITGKTENIRENLDRIIKATKFNNEQYPAYIIISEDCLSPGGLIPEGLMGNILIKREKTTGRKINDDEYIRQVIEISSGIILMSYSDIVEYIFNHNIISTKATLLAKILQLPDRELISQIDNRIIKALLGRLITESDLENPIELNIPGNIDTKNANKNELSTQDVLSPFKVPLFSFKYQRNRAVKKCFEDYQITRYDKLNKYLENVDSESSDYSPENDLYISIKDNFRKVSSLSTLLSNLKRIKSKLDKDIEKPKWDFLQSLDSSQVSGFPFNLSVLIIFGVLLVFSLITQLIHTTLVGPLCQLMILIGYWPIMIIFGIIYVSYKKKSIINTLTRDFQHSFKVFNKNILVNMSIHKSVLKNILSHKLDHYIKRFEEEQTNIQRTIDQMEVKISENEDKIINEWINENIANIFTQIFHIKSNEILNNIDNLPVLIDLLQSELKSTVKYQQLIHLIAEKSKPYLYDELLLKKSTPYFFSQKKKVTNLQHIIICPNNMDIKINDAVIIGTVVENIWATFRVGKINER